MLKANYNFGPQRRVNGGLTVGHGGYFDGTLTEITWRGRVEPGATFLIEPTYSWNQVKTPYGEASAGKDMTSSNIKRAPLPVVRSRRVRRNSGSAGSMPAEPISGSRMTAAIS